MNNKIEVLATDDHMVGFCVRMTHGEFKKLLQRSRTHDMAGWSAAIRKMLRQEPDTLGVFFDD